MNKEKALKNQGLEFREDIIYEGKHKGKDFLFTLLYSDSTTRSIPSSDVYLPKFKLVSGKNHVTVSYNDRPYIVTVEAKSRRQ